jgi:hypothetical protein
MTILLIVMELGRFTISPVESMNDFLGLVFDSRIAENLLNSYNPVDAAS